MQCCSMVVFNAFPQRHQNTRTLESKPKQVVWPVNRWHLQNQYRKHIVVVFTVLWGARHQQLFCSRILLQQQQIIRNRSGGPGSSRTSNNGVASWRPAHQQLAPGPAMHCVAAVYGPLAPPVHCTALAASADGTCWSGAADGSITWWGCLPVCLQQQQLATY